MQRDLLNSCVSQGYEGSLTSGDLHTINIDQVTSMASSYKFYITLFQPLNSPGQISVSNPRNQGCSVGPVLGYPYIVSVTGCGIEVSISRVTKNSGNPS